MDVKPSIVIDLKKYGADGFIEMGRPSLRQVNEMRNMAGKMISSVSEDGTVKLNVMTADMMMRQVMIYVKNAPFKTDLDSFLEFCDTLESNGYEGASVDLFEEMQKASEDINGGKVSPFVSSLVRMMPSSD